MLICYRSSSSVGHFISRFPLPYLTGKGQQGQVRKSQPTEGARVWPGCLAQGRRSVPTLWELLSPLTGELQDLLVITGLRGGLPKTNVSPFTSAWKSHKKGVSSHLLLQRQEELHACSPCTHSMPGPCARPRRRVSPCRQLFRLPLPFTHRHPLCFNPNARAEQSRAEHRKDA